MARHINYGKAIKEAQVQLWKEEKKQSKAFVRDRIGFLRLLKSRQCFTQQTAGALIGQSRRNSQRLWKLYREGGLQALRTYPYKGLPCRLSPGQRAQLNDFVAGDEVQFLHEAKRYIQQQFNVRYSTSAVHYLFGRLHVKRKPAVLLITARMKRVQPTLKKVCSAGKAVWGLLLLLR